MRILYIIFATLIISSCSTTKPISYIRTGEVNAVSHENSIVTLSSVGRAENPGKSIYFAERNAFENLIFKGIPNSNQESPMVPNETDALGNNSALFKSLIVDEGYRRFVMESYTGNQVKNGGVYTIEQIIKIDLKSLRNYLEQEGVSRKFGL